jgi:hypothetical protein
MAQAPRLVPRSGDERAQPRDAERREAEHRLLDRHAGDVGEEHA